MKYIVIFILTFTFCIGYFSHDTLCMGSALLALYVMIFVYCCKNLNEHITLLSFIIAFFTFLMGRMILPIFYDTTELVIMMGGDNFSGRILSNIYLSLFLALLFVFLGYFFTYEPIKRSSCSIDENNRKVVFLRKLSKRIMLFSFSFELLLTLERVLFVVSNGYMALYLDYKSQLPYIVTLIAVLFRYSFCFFLATLPSKKESVIPITLYGFIAVLSLGTGQRNGFVLGILFIIMYLFLRNTLKPGKTIWIGKKGIIGIVVSIPLVVVVLLLMAYARLEKDISTSANLLLTFFYQQGVSVEVIGYTMENADKFPSGRFYLFGDIVDYLRHNIFSQILFGTGPTEPQTVKHALEDHSLDATLTYLVSPEFYFKGGGFGGCYIAEAWKDLGYLGICIVSYIYGYVLCKIPLWCRTNIWKGSAALLMFIPIIYTPRSHAISFIAMFTSTMIILFYLFLYYNLNKINTPMANK